MNSLKLSNCWDSPEVMDFYKDCFENYPDEAQSLKKLLTDDSAGEISQKLKKRNIKFIDFCEVFVSAINGYILINKTPTEYKDFFCCISKRANELALLLDEFPEFNHLPITHFTNCKLRNSSADEELYIDPLEYWPMVTSHLLRQIALKADDHYVQYQDSTYIPKPSAQNVQRNFFIRKLHAFFQEVTKRPCNDITEKCVEICFPDNPVSKNDIEKLIKNIK